MPQCPMHISWCITAARKFPFQDVHLIIQEHGEKGNKVRIKRSMHTYLVNSFVLAAHNISSSNVSCCGELDTLLGHRNHNCNPFPN